MGDHHMNGLNIFKFNVSFFSAYRSIKNKTIKKELELTWVKLEEYFGFNRHEIVKRQIDLGMGRRQKAYNTIARLYADIDRQRMNAPRLITGSCFSLEKDEFVNYFLIKDIGNLAEDDQRILESVNLLIRIFVTDLYRDSREFVGDALIRHYQRNSKKTRKNGNMRLIK